MAENEPTMLVSPGRGRSGYRVLRNLREFGFTALICVVIAVMVWGLSDSDFFQSLGFSLGIGLSTHLFTKLGMEQFPHRHIAVIWLITVPAGVCSGIVIGGLINGIPLSELYDEGVPVASLIIALTATYGFYSYYTMNEMRARIRDQEVAQLRAEKRLVETQLRLLQSQIEPHFLFNTLSHVLSLVRGDPARAEEMLQKLTRFLRASLQRSRAEHASVADELELVENYLAILKIRMGDRLEYTVEARDGAGEVELSPLILQPLVENAVVHGLEPQEAGGRIDVSAAVDGDYLVLTVSDTGAGLGAQSGGSGFGLSNVRNRLQMLYGDRATLEFAEVEPSGLEVTVRIPKERAP